MAPWFPSSLVSFEVYRRLLLRLTPSDNIREYCEGLPPLTIYNACVLVGCRDLVNGLVLRSAVEQRAWADGHCLSGPGLLWILLRTCSFDWHLCHYKPWCCCHFNSDSSKSRDNSENTTAATVVIYYVVVSIVLLCYTAVL